MFSNTNMLKWSHDLVVDICWSVDGIVVVVIIHLG